VIKALSSSPELEELTGQFIKAYDMVTNGTFKLVRYVNERLDTSFDSPVGKHLELTLLLTNVYEDTEGVQYQIELVEDVNPAELEL
jgi:hypothetical protein